MNTYLVVLHHVSSAGINSVFTAQAVWVQADDVFAAAHEALSAFDSPPEIGSMLLVCYGDDVASFHVGLIKTEVARA